MENRRLSRLLKKAIDTSKLIKSENLIVIYQCPECGAIHEFPLDKCPGNTCWVCGKCDPPEDCDDYAYEPFPQVLGVIPKE